MTEIVLPEKGQIYAVVTKEVTSENQASFLAIAKEFCALTNQEGTYIFMIHFEFLLFKLTHHLWTLSYYSTYHEYTHIIFKINFFSSDGCILFHIVRVTNSSSRFLLIEQWQSKQHLEMHFQSNHFKRCAPIISALSTELSCEVCSPAWSSE